MTAKDIWVRINPTEINNALTSEYLSILEPLLERSAEDTPLKDDKIEKAQIYKMTVLHKLHFKKFRKKIFDCFENEELHELSKEINLPIDTDESMKQNLLDIPWDYNKNAIKIANFIGVPSFILEISSNENYVIPYDVTPWFMKYNLYLNPFNKSKLDIEFANRTPFKTLKSFQAIAHQEVLEKININLGRTLLNMPTGTGKTRTAMEIICSFLLENKHQSIVWIANTRELLDQAALEFSQIWEYMGDRNIKILRQYEKQNINLSESTIIITSFQTLLNNTSNFSNIPIGLIVIDEAHMTIAKKWSNAVKSLIKTEYGTKIIGLTATPLRSKSSETKKLITFYHKNIIQLKYTNSDDLIFDFLVNNKYLAKPIYEKLEGKDIYLSNQIIKKIQNENKEFPKNFLEKLAKDGQRNLIITQKLKDILGNPEDKKQILFFGISVEHSKMIATWLLRSGYSAFHLDSSVDLVSRKSCINAFKSGKIRVLCNYGVLSTGFDVPKIDCVFIARPTTSHVLHSQMIGRGLRGPKLGGTETCLIVEVEDNITNFASDQRVSFENYKKMWEIKPEDLDDDDDTYE